MGRVRNSLASIGFCHQKIIRLRFLGSIRNMNVLAEILPRDANGNVAKGEVGAVDCRDSLLFAEEGTVAALGVEGLVVVKTRDSVLVVPKDRTQEIRDIVAALEDRGLDELL